RSPQRRPETRHPPRVRHRRRCPQVEKVYQSLRRWLMKKFILVLLALLFLSCDAHAWGSRRGFRSSFNFRFRGSFPSSFGFSRSFGFANDFRFRGFFPYGFPSFGGFGYQRSFSFPFSYSQGFSIPWWWWLQFQSPPTFQFSFPQSDTFS